MRKDGDLLYITLTTGELITMSSKDGKILSGPFKTVPQNRNIISSSQVKSYPDSTMAYQGEGIWIQMDSTAKDKRTGKEPVKIRSMVNGKESVCSMSANDIWERKWGYKLPKGHENYSKSYYDCTLIKFQTDQEFYKNLKLKCPNFQFPPLIE